MSTSPDSPYRTIRPKKPIGPSPPQPSGNAGAPGPTTFFLRSEREIEKGNEQQRGRTTSRDASIEDSNGDIGQDPDQNDGTQTQELDLPYSTSGEDSVFGVQSLEDTISFNIAREPELSRTISRGSATSSKEASVSAIPRTASVGQKRKAGNPVHPKIHATGQRIIAGEHGYAVSIGSVSPDLTRSEAASPLRTHRRRGSGASSINASQPLTPLQSSPQPDSAIPSTPRSGSPKSFKLSDEEASVASETESQAIASSSSEEEESGTVADQAAMPQLVMPSLAMPTRRPFTDRGRRIGKLKLMVVGAHGVGKTSLIHAICRACEDIVHVDPPNTDEHLDGICQVCASTRSYPSWRTDFDSRRMLLRRKSLGDGVLERNLTFIDTRGFSDAEGISRVQEYFRNSLRRTASLDSLNDSELVDVLSGEGGIQVDVVLYVFDARSSPTMKTTPHTDLSFDEEELLQYLCKWTTVVPVIARADTVTADDLALRKKDVIDIFHRSALEIYLGNPNVRSVDGAEHEQMPFATCSALSDDSDTIDASVLMASSYLQPLVPSELDHFVHDLLEPDNVARLRHISATKFLLWRQQNLGVYVNRSFAQQQLSPVCHDDHTAPASTSSLQDEPSKVILPPASSSYYRSASPAAPSEVSISLSASSCPVGSSSCALGPLVTTNESPFRQLRLAKWASDLQRSLDHERQRYRAWYTQSASSPSSPSLPGSVPTDAIELTSSSALLPFANARDSTSRSSLRKQHHSHPLKGRLGGPLSVIDPRDPLGLLTLQRRGWLLLRVVGAGAALFWALRSIWPEWWIWNTSWSDWYSTSMPSSSARPIAIGVPPPSHLSASPSAAAHFTTYSIPPPPTSGLSFSITGTGLGDLLPAWVSEPWKSFFGWDR